VLSRPKTGTRRSLGFSWPVLVALAALAAPRVVLHDLGLIEEGTFVNGLFVFVPPACWIVAVVWKRPRRPFASVVAIGDELLWNATIGDRTDPALQEGLLRAAAVVSSLVTGTLVGVVAGAVAVALTRILPAPASRKTEPAEDRA
jgi:hypothetical protein